MKKIFHFYQIVYCVSFLLGLQSIVDLMIAGGVRQMNENSGENLALAWEGSHPWLTLTAETTAEEDPYEEAIQYSLDEMRFD